MKATALGRQDGFEAYKKALNFVALNYPQSEEGKQAEKIYATVLPGLASKEFISEEEENSWKVVYKFEATEREESAALLEKLNEAISYFHYTHMSISMDYYDPSTNFVIIHGLRSERGGRGFAEVLEEKKEFKIKRAFFEISSSNYKVIQIHKNLEDYLTSTKMEEENSNPQN